MKKKRKGPYPLIAHIGMMLQPEKGWAADIQEYAAPHFSEAKAQDMERVMRGIKLYQNHPFKAEREKGRIIWKIGSVSVERLYSQKGEADRGAILLIPSLINAASIFDLCQERSFASFMAQQGFRIYLLDWGNTAKNDAGLNLDAAITERLLPAIKAACSDAGDCITLAGYCMGGTLSLAASALEPERIKEVVLLAAPWDFRAGNNILSDRVREWAPAAMMQIEQKGAMSSLWTQTLFATLDPAGSSKKFARFAEMDQNCSEARIFVAVEDWLNEGLDIAQGIARDVLQKWFALNAPAKGEWAVDRKIIDPSALKAPVMLVASSGDRLVPFESSDALGRAMQKENISRLELDCGHIGLIAGSRAVQDVWSPIARWLLR